MNYTTTFYVAEDRPYGAHSPERLGWRAVPVAQILARAIAADHTRINRQINERSYP